MERSVTCLWPRPKGPSWDTTKFTVGKIWPGPSWYTNCWVSPPPPTPSSNTSHCTALSLVQVLQFRNAIRTQARADKAIPYLQECDKLRDVGFPNVGVQLQDTRDGSTFKLRDRDELLKEMEEVRMAAEEKRALKQKRKEELERQKAAAAQKKADQIARQRQKEQEKREKAAKEAAAKEEAAEEKVAQEQETQA